MTVPKPQGRLARIGVFVGLVSVLGCGDKRPVITGTVLVDGKPAEGVYVVLHAADQPAGPDRGTDRTTADGSFSLVVDAPGEVVVNAFWPQAKVTKEGDTVEGADQFAGRYRDARNPVTQIHVREGRNAVPPIELTRPARGKANNARNRR